MCYGRRKSKDFLHPGRCGRSGSIAALQQSALAAGTSRNSRKPATPPANHTALRAKVDHQVGAEHMLEISARMPSNT